MSKEALTFGKIKIEKNKFSHLRLIFFLVDVDNEKVLVSNKIFFCVKKI